MKRVYITEDGMIFEGELADLIEELDDLGRSLDEQLNKKKSKGESIMDKVFKKASKVKVVKINKEEGTIKRKAKVIKDITVESVKGSLSEPLTYVAGGVVGLQQGLKYKGDFKAGGKAGIATVAVFTGIDVAINVVNNIDLIKKA